MSLTKKDVFKTLKNELRELYVKGFSEKRLDWLTEALCNVIFDEKIGLDDVVFSLDEFEETLSCEHDSEFFSVLNLVLDLLEKNKINADKLFEFFIDSYQDIDLFVRLMNDYRIYLSEEQLERLKSESVIFDENALKNLIFDWDN